MSDIIHIQTTIERDGEVHLSDLPLKQGQQIELHVRVLPPSTPTTQTLTAQDLVTSTIVGIWADRVDIDDSIRYAQQLREQAQRRER